MSEAEQAERVAGCKTRVNGHCGVWDPRSEKMSGKLSTRHVSKFDGANFLGWKFQINQIFVANKVQDIVNGDRVMPADRESAAAKAWIKDNAKAIVCISSSMEYSQFEPLLTGTTAKAMWDKQAAIYVHKSASNRLLLTQRFHEYRMGLTDTIVQYMAKVQNMATQLVDLGENVSDVTIMAIVLASLTTKYSAFQTAWDSVEPARQTIENLQERLFREESRLNADSDKVTAFAAMKVSKASTSESSKSKPRKKSVGTKLILSVSFVG